MSRSDIEQFMLQLFLISQYVFFFITLSTHFVGSKIPFWLVFSLNFNFNRISSHTNSNILSQKQWEEKKSYKSKSINFSYTEVRPCFPELNIFH